MTLSVEQLCQSVADHRLLPSAELSRLRARWFQAKRADVNDVNKFGQWLSVNNYLTAFTFRMLRDGKADLLRLNQYQLTDHPGSGPFAGAYLALDPLQRQVVVEVLGGEEPAQAGGVDDAAGRLGHLPGDRHAGVVAVAVPALLGADRPAVGPGRLGGRGPQMEAGPHIQRHRRQGLPLARSGRDGVLLLWLGEVPAGSGPRTLLPITNQIQGQHEITHH